jgi:hypothetical protein
MGKRIDVTGKKFNRLLVIEMLPMKKIGKHSVSIIKAKCDCGIIKEYSYAHVKSGHTKSCGCYLMEKAADSANKNKKHGQSSKGKESSEYISWKCMKSRCLYKGSYNYKKYGGVGITICKKWIDSFDCFLSDMGKKPTVNHTLDRIDNTGNYEPSNCRWATRKEQNNNQSTNILYNYNGNMVTIPVLADLVGINKGTLRSRLVKYKWDFNDAISIPVKKK